MICYGVHYIDSIIIYIAMIWNTQSPIYQTLQPKQEEFMDIFAKYRLFGGAKGWGKSYWMRAECVKQMLSTDWVRWLALRRTYEEIEENMLVPLQSELPKEMRHWNASKHVFRLRNGSTLKLWHCQSFNDVYKYQGLQFDFICIEELTQRTETERKILMGCLRTSKTNYFTNAFFSSNPGNVWHQRVKRLFIKRDFRANEKPEDYAFIPAKVYDNDFLMNNDPHYVQTLEQLPEVYRAAYLDGNWDVFAWQFFNEFDRDIHVIPPMELPPEKVKMRARALDYWYAAPSCVLWGAKDTQGNIYIYRELYKKELTYTKLGKMIKALNWEGEEFSRQVWDPAAVNKKAESNETTLKKEFEKLGIWIDTANNERVAGRNRIRELLKPFRDPNTWKKTARLFICANCVNLINTLPDLIHDKTRIEDIDSKWEDHAADALRYLLAELAEINTWFEDIKELNEAHKRNYQDKKPSPPGRSKSEQWNIAKMRF